MRRPRLLLLPLILLLAGTAAPAHAAMTVRSAAGASAAAIRPTVDQFRADLGASNSGAPAPAGRREISWDSVPDTQSDPNNLPPAFFSSQGAVLSTPGSGLRVSSNKFGHPSLFATFSGQRLFSPLGSSTTTVVNLYVPSTATPALSRGFGAVFTNVDTAGHSSIELFDAAGQLLVTRDVKPATGDGTLSFLGISFGEGRVALVRITSGDHAPDSGSSANDRTVLDDFVYGEPVKDGADADGVSLNDNCPSTANSGQENVDEDALGDACDEDADNDGAPNAQDAFPLDKSETLDTDVDGIGDNRDTDDDNDTLTDVFEGRLGTDPKRADTDADGRLDSADNCPVVANPDQRDRDGNGRGDACDDLLAPLLSRLALTPSAFQRGSKNGTRISFRLSESATVRLTVRRAVSGHRVGRICVRGTPGRRSHNPHCTIWAPVRGSISRTATAGTNFVKFEGRIGGQALKPGRHLLLARASDAARNAGARTARAKFTIVR